MSSKYNWTQELTTPQNRLRLSQNSVIDTGTRIVVMGPIFT